MTNIKDPIRQASLFTRHGLLDPRFSEETGVSKKDDFQFSLWPARITIISWIEDIALRRSIFRFKKMKT